MAFDLPLNNFKVAIVIVILHTFDTSTKQRQLTKHSNILMHRHISTMSNFARLTRHELLSLSVLLTMFRPLCSLTFIRCLSMDISSCSYLVWISHCWPCFHRVVSLPSLEIELTIILTKFTNQCSNPLGYCLMGNRPISVLK